MPVAARFGFATCTSARLPVGAAAPRPTLILATLYYQDRPFDDTFADYFDRQMRPVLAETGATPLARLQTEHANNSFPALPVRTGENVFAWFARFSGPAALDDHLSRLERSVRWQNRVLPSLSKILAGPPRKPRLAPTARSLLH
jgi:hypothetical protein